jgi:hypothetical protein
MPVVQRHHAKAGAGIVLTVLGLADLGPACKPAGPARPAPEILCRRYLTPLSGYQDAQRAE